MNKIFKQKEIWIVTDLDGTLMDHNYDLSPAIPTLEWLKSISIPVILCTSKTASEVRKIRINNNLTDPYIVENGGAVYGQFQDNNKEWNLVLGKTYKQLRIVIKEISNRLGIDLIPLNDLSDIEINQLTGLKGDDIELALNREWSVPFLNVSDHFHKLVEHEANHLGAVVYKGNRMSHLLSKESNKGKAVNKLKSFLNQPNVKIIALGDSPNDLPLLEVADIPVVIPGLNGPNKLLLDSMNNIDYLIADEPNGSGWAKIIQKLLS